MGGFAGAISGISNQLHEEHKRGLDEQRANNLAMAQQFKAMAEDPNTLQEYRIPFLQASMAWQMLPPGKKAPKGIPELQQMVIQHNRARLLNPNQDGQPQAAVGGQGAAPLAPGPQQQMTTPPQSTGGDDADIEAAYRQGLGTPPFVDPAAVRGQAPQRSPQAAQAAQAIQAQQAEASAPNAMSGLPGPGFGAGLTPPPGGIPNLAPSWQLSTPDRIALQQYIEATKAEAQRQAEFRGKKQLFAFEREQNKRLMEDLKATGTRHFKVRVTANGGMGFEPDIGKADPGFVNGAELPEDAVDSKGAVIPPEKRNQFFLRRRYENGEIEYEPKSGVTSVHVVQDLNSPTGASYEWRDRAGRMIGERVTGAPAGALATETTITTTTPGFHDFTDTAQNIQTLPIEITKGSTVGRRVPGQVAPTPFSPPPRTGARITGTAIPAPPLPRNPNEPPGTPAPRISTISPKQTKAQWENELLPEARKAIEETTPTLNMVDRALTALEPMKNDNTPFSHWVERQAYRFGLATDFSSLVNNLELGRVVGASRILRGGSRALDALKDAMVHLPASGTDSNKLMYEKLIGVRKNLADIINVMREEGQKYPNMPRTKSSLPPAITPYPGAGTVRMRAPDGSEKPVPADQVEFLKSRGAVVVQ